MIHEYLNAYCAQVPRLTVVRNDVYARFSHEAYSKGTALSEIARRLDVRRDHILAAGDHLNDLPMLSQEHARWLVAPSNAIELVKQTVRRQEGFVSVGLADCVVVVEIDAVSKAHQQSAAAMDERTEALPVARR